MCSVPVTSVPPGSVSAGEWHFSASSQPLKKLVLLPPEMQRYILLLILVEIQNKGEGIQRRTKNFMGRG